jgi:hypothetical protein
LDVRRFGCSGSPRGFDATACSQPEPFTFGNLNRNTPDLGAGDPRNFDLSLVKEFGPPNRISGTGYVTSKLSS